MFKFLKEKLGNVLKKFTKEAEKAPAPEEKKPVPEIEKPAVEKQEPERLEHPSPKKEGPKKETKHEERIETYLAEAENEEPEKETHPAAEERMPERKGFLSSIFGSKPREEEKKREAETKPAIEDIAKKREEPQEEKKGFLSRVSETFTKFQLSDEKFEEIFWDLEVALLESNVAVEVIERIKKDLKQELTSEKISRKNPDEIISERLTKTITEILSVEPLDFDKEIRRKKPYIIAVIGVNGSGKTTTIAKLVRRIQKSGLSVVLAAADTFRAAAIQQLETHAEKLGVKLIKHDYNSDPAAVAFDAVRHAEAKGIDVVIIDTAGRLHSNDNLMNELRKLIKVNKPDMKLFIGESITGNDCVEQAKVYNEQVGIDAIILSKADIDEKGGAALSISYVTQKPVIFLGTGQAYDDLKEFSVAYILSNLGLEA